MTDKVAHNVLLCGAHAMTILALTTTIALSSELAAAGEQTASPAAKSAAPAPTTLSTELVPWKGD